MSDDTFPPDGFGDVDGTDHDAGAEDEPAAYGSDPDAGPDELPGLDTSDDDELSDLDTSDLDTSDLDTSDLDTSDLDTSDLDTSDGDMSDEDVRDDDRATDPADDGQNEPGEVDDSVILVDHAADIDADAAYRPDLVGTLDVLGVDPAEFDRTMQQLGLDQAADGRSVVVTLERLGVDAHLEFGDVDRLAEHLAAGAEVRLASGHVLVGLDDVADEAVLERHGAESRLALEALEDAWIDHGYESVVTDGAERLIVLLPLTGDAERGGMSG